MSRSIIIFGKDGYFGSKLTDLFIQKGWSVHCPSVQDADITNYRQVKEYLEFIRPDVVLNAAGATGRPNVDWCEDNKAQTTLLNVVGPLNIATVCHDNDIFMVHLSSGCIYNGDNNGLGYSEEDTPNFSGSFYSRTKAAVEASLAEFDVLQLRIRIPIEAQSSSKNVIDKLLQYEKIISIQNSFTVVEDFLDATYQLVDARHSGIFNMTNIGSMDHEYLMRKYQEIVDPEYTYTVMSLDELHEQTKAKRSNCILQTDKREALGIHMPPIQERIIEILHAYKDNK